MFTWTKSKTTTFTNYQLSVGNGLFIASITNWFDTPEDWWFTMYVCNDRFRYNFPTEDGPAYFPTLEQTMDHAEKILVNTMETLHDWFSLHYAPHELNLPRVVVNEENKE